ncbi:MAG: flavin prenyltransferase UbiX [Treponemataceae bacterium]
MKRYVLGICGASGGVYALRALRLLASCELETHVVVSAEGERVLFAETGVDIGEFIAAFDETARSHVIRHAHNNFFASISSGSFRTDGMLVLPCTLSAIGSIANGTGGDLLRRAADVHIKERRPLVLVPRETPLSVIHLRNMLTLAQAGAVILPACPGFYGKPKTIDDLVDFVVGRALTALGVDCDLAPEWDGK